jgi:hypothetical protein
MMPAWVQRSLPSSPTLSLNKTCMPYDLSLREAATAVVLLSRTRSANKIFFVGDKKETIKHLLNVPVYHQHRFLRYITDLLNKLCGKRTSVPILRQPTVFRPKDTILTSVRWHLSPRQHKSTPTHLYWGRIQLDRTTTDPQQGPRTQSHRQFWSPFLCHVRICHRSLT